MTTKPPTEQDLGPRARALIAEGNGWFIADQHGGDMFGRAEDGVDVFLRSICSTTDIDNLEAYLEANPGTEDW